MTEPITSPSARQTPEELADALLRADNDRHGQTIAAATQSFSVAARVRALLIEGIVAARTEPCEVEWNVRQHDGRSSTMTSMMSRSRRRPLVKKLRCISAPTLSSEASARGKSRRADAGPA